MLFDVWRNEFIKAQAAIFPYIKYDSLPMQHKIHHHRNQLLFLSAWLRMSRTAGNDTYSGLEITAPGVLV